ncbi:MAG: hypothetical protein JWO09_1566 [Bacteroidetes bacterium]|nr:hypothetical protein [Bacteroidota bacterium]
MLNSGKVLPKGQMRFGKNYTINISTSPISQSVRGAYNLSDNFASKDTIYYNEQVEYMNAALLSYCLDPIGVNDELYFRYGLGRRFDLGFKNSGGSNAFDVQYQFLGSTKSVDQVKNDKNGFYGSIGAQYSWQNYRFLNYRMFDKVQHIFGMDMSRKDITIPLIFSTSFGPEERVGCFSFGLVYSHSFIKYKIVPKNIYAADRINPELLEPVNAKVQYDAFGTFLNFKIGKKIVFFNLSLAVYYQDYGRYPMLGGTTKSLKGFTFIPSYGVQFNLLKKNKKKGSPAKQA